MYDSKSTTKTFTSKSRDISENENTASALNRSQQENIDLFAVINSLEQTMQTLSNYREQLKTQLDFNLTQQDVYKLLNKNFQLKKPLTKKHSIKK